MSSLDVGALTDFMAVMTRLLTLTLTLTPNPHRLHRGAPLTHSDPNTNPTHHPNPNLNPNPNPDPNPSQVALSAYAKRQVFTPKVRPGAGSGSG